MRALAVGVGLAILAACVPGAAVSGPPGPHVVVLGKGMGPWRSGMSYRSQPGRLRSVRHPKLGLGCVTGPLNARRIDYYEGIRVSWYPDLDNRLYLAEVATTRAGDRTGKGLVIGQATLAQARHAYPKAKLDRAPRSRYGGYSLAKTQLHELHMGRGETWTYLDLWFDGSGRLVALATGGGGC